MPKISFPSAPLWLILFFFCTAATPAQQSAKRAMTIEDIFALKRVSDPQISPDGARVVYVVSSADFERGRWDSDLWLVKTGEVPPSPRQLTFNVGRDSSPRWSPDGKTIAFLRARPEANASAAQIYLLPIGPGGEAYPVTREPLGINSFAWAPDGGAIFYAAATRPASSKEPKAAQDRAVVEDEGRASASLWYLNLATGEKSRIATGPGHVREFAVAPDGKALVFTAAPTPYFNEGPQTELYYLALTAAESVAPRQLTRNSLITESGMAWHPDGAGVAFLADADKTLAQRALQGSLFFWDRASGDIRHVPVNTTATAQEKFSGPIEQVAWISPTRLLVIAGSGASQRLHWVNWPAGESGPVSKSQAVTGDVSVDRAGAKAAFIRESPDQAGEIWLLDMAQERLSIYFGGDSPDNQWSETPLTQHNAAFREANLLLPQFSVVRWRASDGQTVEGIYFEPPASLATKQRYPLITMIHGGPASAELAAFHPFANVLAGAGFAVFLPNYRGSTNYGEEFAARSVGDRNGRDAQDILEGIDELIRRGWVDKDRLGVMGWSAGGVLTNWLVANTTRFRAASTGAGVADWRMQYFLSDYTYGSRYYMLGSPWEKNDFYWERSPLRLAAQVKTPTLIHCGERDERVPIAHARAWFRALREHGVATRFVVYPGEPHSLQQPAHQRRRNEEDFRWFTRHLLAP